jgi:hypothetical protein
MKSYRETAIDALQADYVTSIWRVWRLVSELQQQLDDSITLRHIKNYCLTISNEIEKIESLKKKQLDERAKESPIVAAVSE